MEEDYDKEEEEDHIYVFPEEEKKLMVKALGRRESRKEEKVLKDES